MKPRVSYASCLPRWVSPVCGVPTYRVGPGRAVYDAAGSCLVLNRGCRRGGRQHHLPWRDLQATRHCHPIVIRGVKVDGKRRSSRAAPTPSLPYGRHRLGADHCLRGLRGDRRHSAASSPVRRPHAARLVVRNCRSHGLLGADFGSGCHPRALGVLRQRLGLTATRSTWRSTRTLPDGVFRMWFNWCRRNGGIRQVPAARNEIYCSASRAYFRARAHRRRSRLLRRGIVRETRTWSGTSSSEAATPRSEPRFLRGARRR
jgi:hypothetical protein